jgi:hypothetical protein
MGKHTEKAKARDPAMIGVLPSFAGGERGWADLIYTVKEAAAPHGFGRGQGLFSCVVKQIKHI